MTLELTEQTLFVWLRRLGIPGATGGVLLAVAAWMYMSWLPQQVSKVDALSSEVRHVRHDLQQTESGTVQGKSTKELKPWDLSGLDPRAAWQTVWDTLPDDSQRMSLLSAVTASASKQGVNIASVQYRGAIEPWSIQQGMGLWRERMTMPVEGRYGDVRAWLGSLLNQSSLSVDALDITRTDTTNDLVKGRVSVSLWWRTANTEHTAQGQLK